MLNRSNAFITNTGFFGRDLPCRVRANTAPGKQRWLRDRAVWRGMRGGGPQSQVGQGVVDDLGLAPPPRVFIKPLRSTPLNWATFRVPVQPNLLFAKKVF